MKPLDEQLGVTQPVVYTEDPTRLEEEYFSTQRQGNTVPEGNTVEKVAPETLQQEDAQPQGTNQPSPTVEPQEYRQTKNHLDVAGSAALRNIANEYNLEPGGLSLGRDYKDSNGESSSAIHSLGREGNRESFLSEGVVPFGALEGKDVRGADLSGLRIEVEKAKEGSPAVTMRLEDFLLNCETAAELARVMPNMTWQCGDGTDFKETVFSADKKIQAAIIANLTEKLECKEADAADPANPADDLRGLCVPRTELLYVDVWDDAADKQATLTYFDFKAKHELQNEFLREKLKNGGEGVLVTLARSDCSEKQLGQFEEQLEQFRVTQSGSGDEPNKELLDKLGLALHKDRTKDELDSFSEQEVQHLSDLNKELRDHVNNNYKDRALQLRQDENFIETDELVKRRNESQGEITPALIRKGEAADQAEQLSEPSSQDGPSARVTPPAEVTPPAGAEPPAGAPIRKEEAADQAEQLSEPSSQDGPSARVTPPAEVTPPAGAEPPAEPPAGAPSREGEAAEPSSQDGPSVWDKIFNSLRG